MSDNYTLAALFYRALFDLKSQPNAKFEISAQAVGDGYVGMNINPRVPGRHAGFDHFGIQVADVETVKARVTKKYPTIEITGRPNRPFAALGMHDPAGNYFDLSQAGLANRAEVYEGGAWEQPRRYSYFALRAVEPERLATFYADVFQFDYHVLDGVHHLSDGRMTMAILQWRLSDFLGSGIERPALDHLGFEVDNLTAFEHDFDEIKTINPMFAAKVLGLGPEGAVRKMLLERSGFGQLYLCDPDGVLLAVRERPVPRE